MTRHTLTALALLLTVAACAPRADTPDELPNGAAPPQTAPETPTPPQLTDPAARAVDRAAREAFHLMGLGYARTGAYSVNVLVSDLELPSGARWQLENLAEETYALRFTSDDVPDFSWLVMPDGVVIEQAENNQIL